MIREITEHDFDQLMTLYMQLHDNLFPEKDEHVMELWNCILADKNHHIIVAEEDGAIVSSCVCVIIPNPDKPEKILQFLHISSTIKKNVGGCVHVTYR